MSKILLGDLIEGDEQITLLHDGKIYNSYFICFTYPSVRVILIILYSLYET